jgi:hypothetical protein
MITLVIMGKIAAAPRSPGEIMTLIFEMPLHGRWSWGWVVFLPRVGTDAESARACDERYRARVSDWPSPALAPDIPFENYSLLCRNLRLL